MRIVKKALAGITITIVALIFCAFVASPPIKATAQESDSNTSIESQREESLFSATLVYDGDTIDVLRNTYIISIDDHKDLDLTFDVSDTASKIKLRNITEDGDAKFVCETIAKKINSLVSEFSCHKLTKTQP